MATGECASLIHEHWTYEEYGDGPEPVSHRERIGPPLSVVPNDILPVQDGRFLLEDASRVEAPGAESLSRINDAGDRLRLPEVIRLTDGSTYRLIHFFGTPGHETMTELVASRRAERYHRANWLENSDPEVAGGQKGSNVEFLVLVDPQTGEPVASVRLFHGGDVGEMPSVAKARDANAVGECDEQLLRDMAAGRPVAEICDLWGDCPPDAIRQLYLVVAHISSWRNEALVAGTVAPVVRAMFHYFGPYVVQGLGEPFGTGDPTARETVKLRLLAMDPTTLVPDMLRWVRDARDAIDGAGADIERRRKAQADFDHRVGMLRECVHVSPAKFIDDAARSELEALTEKPAA